MKELLFAIILTLICAEVLEWFVIGIYMIVEIVRKKVGADMNELKPCPFCGKEIDLAEEHENDFCEWKLDGVYLHCQHDTELPITCLEEEKYRYKYCPVCGKKIRIMGE